MRLLFISFAFPPFNSIGGLRVGKTVKYLNKFGHDVRVLTARDQPFLLSLPVETLAENIIYSKWLNVRKPVEIGLREGSVVTRNERAQLGFRLSLRQFLSSQYRSIAYFPDTAVGWIPWALADASRLIESWKPELIIASAPPPTSLVVAHRLSRKFGIPWIADMRDLWVDHQYYEQPGWRKAIEERVERRVLSSASGFVTVSEPLAETLRVKYQKPTAIVLNGYDPDDYPSTDHVVRDNDLRIVYTGVIYAGKQDPSPLFRALHELGPISKRIKISFYGSYLSSVRELANRHGISDMIEVHDPVPYLDSLKLQAEADILLLLLWNDQNYRGVYTGKLFEYVGSRRPILAVGATENVAADLVRERGAGLVTNDTSVIAGQLLKWIKEKDAKGAIPSLPETVSAGISREEQTRLLENYLFEALRTNASASVTSSAQIKVHN